MTRDTPSVARDTTIDVGVTMTVTALLAAITTTGGTTDVTMTVTAAGMTIVAMTATMTDATKRVVSLP